MSLPELPQDIKSSMKYVREMSDWITMHPNPTISDLETAESKMANSLAYLCEKREEYQGMFDAAKDKYDAAVEDAFEKYKMNKETDGSAKVKANKDCREQKQKLLEAKYLYKMLKAFTDSRRDVVISIIHRIKSKRDELRGGYGN